MKPEPVELFGICDVHDVIERVLETRLREARSLAEALQERDRRGLHDFRIACKRLRYALERFEVLEPTLDAAAERLALVQDALGETHDRDVLLGILPPTMPRTKRRLQKEREAHADRAAELWEDVLALVEPRNAHSARYGT